MQLHLPFTRAWTPAQEAQDPKTQRASQAQDSKTLLGEQSGEPVEPLGGPIEPSYLQYAEQFTGEIANEELDYLQYARNQLGVDAFAAPEPQPPAPQPAPQPSPPALVVDVRHSLEATQPMTGVVVLLTVLVVALIIALTWTIARSRR